MIARGEFVRTKYGMICAACAERLNAEQEQEDQEAAQAAPPPAPEAEPAPEPPTDRANPAVVEAPPPPPAPEPEPQPEPQAPEPQPPERVFDDPEAAVPLAAMHQHVEAIHRILMFEKSSTWNIAATVTQCLAVGMLVIALFNWLENPQGVLNILLVALILQVMALTFYVKGK